MTGKQVAVISLLGAAVAVALGVAAWRAGNPRPRPIRRERGRARELRSPGLGQYDIAPGETRLPDGSRDLVLERSMESFPASDAGGV